MSAGALALLNIPSTHKEQVLDASSLDEEPMKEKASVFHQQAIFTVGQLIR